MGRGVLAPKMTLDIAPHGFLKFVALCAVLVVLLAWSVPCECFEPFDMVTGILESPQFKGKDPLTKLRLVAELIRSNKLKPSDVAFSVLDWGDQYLAEPSDALERLKRWAELTNDDQLARLRIPRDFFNRAVLAEYLVSKTTYLKSPPQHRLEILQKLEEKNLVDWSVALDYSRLYAGSIIAGAKSYQSTPPFEGLKVLKRLKDEGLVGWHYRVPTEAILVAEALALDKDYRKASNYEKLVRLRDLERKGLITMLTKKELERLPVWRFLIADSSFLAADASVKKDRLLKLKNEDLISSATHTELRTVFRAGPSTSPAESPPIPPLRTIPSPLK